jgi:DNA polymerase I
MPQILTDIRNARIHYFKPKSKIIKEYSSIEQGLKVLINATFGVITSDFFPFFVAPAGEIITDEGRASHIFVVNHFEKLGYKVIYGDTDSIFITGKEFNVLKNDVENLNTYLGMELNIESKFERLILYKRKNYIGINNDIMIKGLLGKKKNIPIIIKRMFDELLSLVIENPPDMKVKLIEKYRLHTKKINSEENIDEFVSRTILSKPPSQYTTMTPAIKVINEIYDGMNTMVSKDKVFNNCVISFVVTGNKGNKFYHDPRFVINTKQINRDHYHDIYRKVSEQILIPHGISSDVLNYSGGIDEFF